MTSTERKLKTETYLKSFKIPVLDTLPRIEEEHEVKLRSAAEIAKRVLILVYLNVAADKRKAQKDIIAFLKKEELWNDVSETEKELFQKENLTSNDKVEISWRTESVSLLLWAIKKIDALNLPVLPASIPDLVKHFPKFLTSPADFINAATIRPVNEILDMSDLMYRLHWATRSSQLTGTKTNVQLNPSIVYERHYAINWVTYYADNWDDVTTDT